MKYSRHRAKILLDILCAKIIIFWEFGRCIEFLTMSVNLLYYRQKWISKYLRVSRRQIFITKNWILKKGLTGSYQNSVQISRVEEFKTDLWSLRRFENSFESFCWAVAPPRNQKLATSIMLVIQPQTKNMYPKFVLTMFSLQIYPHSSSDNLKYSKIR